MENVLSSSSRKLDTNRIDQNKSLKIYIRFRLTLNKGSFFSFICPSCFNDNESSIELTHVIVKHPL